ncbi:uncharacterized protein Ecym_2268 [Eremothecium cymbalariae DBVPG|uniref:Uncharacterized protein n=1 Tax=Eremothecium cymbalariae (strain CBS 270.75 / DBVPG 7215 / KCTC 17166 / NRRL Y-17582) TaxID=931890 RepID=G8JPQ9_ERECY|nr:Hypothetical protein Ecym_2268 [Eremothecium cymbalariae DBVPG\
MGLCASKDHLKKEVRVVNQKKPTKKNQKKPAKTSKAGSTSKPHIRKTPTKEHNPSESTVSKGKKLSEITTVEDTQLTPREAAKKAAEERINKQKEKLEKGELGRRLANERAKSGRNLLQESIRNHQIQKISE